MEQTTIQNEINRLTKLKKEGALNEREYNALVEKTLHPKSDWRRLLNFQAMSPEEKRQKILLAMLSLGVISILTGLGLIIGANWSVIPYAVKLGGALALLAVSLMGVVYCRNNNHPNLVEVCLGAAFLLIAGNMAVIQQYMHTSLTWNQGSAIWWGLSLPLLFFTKKIWLPMASVFLFVFGVWNYLYELFEYLNYMAVCGVFCAIVYASFLGGGKVKLLRNAAFVAGIFILIAGDVRTDDIIGLISTVVFLVCLAPLPRNAVGQVRFCNYLSVFIVWRIFLLFCTAYHNLMSMGVQLIVFGTVLLAIAGGYYYFFNAIQNMFNRLINHEK